jgi:phosphoglycolate phosphatase
MRQDKAFIFDLDGTLLDTSVDIAQGVNRMRAHFGLKALPIDKVISYIGDGAMKLTERSLQDSTIAPEEAIEVFLKCYEADICSATDFYPGMKEFILTLKERGIPTGILTNKPQRLTDKLIGELDISHFFHFVTGPDDVGKKPNPNGLIQSIKTLNVSPEDAFMVGDHHTDMYAGNAAGVTTVFVHYGYGIIGESRADVEIQSADELFKLL